jgi:hypothetical protein
VIARSQTLLVSIFIPRSGIGFQPKASSLYIQASSSGADTTKSSGLSVTIFVAVFVTVGVTVAVFVNVVVIVFVIVTVLFTEGQLVNNNEQIKIKIVDKYILRCFGF